MAVDAAEDELRHWCEVAAVALPSNGRARLASSTLALSRTRVECKTVLLELVRIVRLFLEPWERQGKGKAMARALQALANARDTNRQLIARLAVASAGAARLGELQTLHQWERCFVATVTQRSHGRRWRHLIDSFRHREEAAQREGRLPDDEPDDDERDGHRDVDGGTPDGGAPLPVKPIKHIKPNSSRTVASSLPPPGAHSFCTSPPHLHIQRHSSFSLPHFLMAGRPGTIRVFDTSQI